MKKPFRLLIAVPCTDYMHADFVKSLMNLTGHLQREGIRFHVEIMAGTLVYFARNSLACKAINEDFTHILFLDSDMVFDEEIVETLTFCGKDFVCGAFQSRRPPYGSCVFSQLKPLTKVTEYGKEPFRVKGCGMACTLISTEILRAVQLANKTCFLPEMQWGEDLTFCRRARALGYKIYAEPCVRLGHIGHEVIWPEDHARYMERLEKG